MAVRLVRAVYRLRHQRNVNAAFVAFFGMYLLLQRHVIQGERYEFIASGVALAFSFLPFLPTSGLSFAGMPLVLYAFLNIRPKRRQGRTRLIFTVGSLLFEPRADVRLFPCGDGRCVPRRLDENETVER